MSTLSKARYRELAAKATQTWYHPADQTMYVQMGEGSRWYTAEHTVNGEVTGVELLFLVSEEDRLGWYRRHRRMKFQRLPDGRLLASELADERITSTYLISRTEAEWLIEGMAADALGIES